MKHTVSKSLVILFCSSKILADRVNTHCETKSIPFTYKAQEDNYYHRRQPTMFSKTINIWESTCYSDTQRSATEILKEIYNERRYSYSGYMSLYLKSSFSVLTSFPSDETNWNQLWKLTLQKNNISKIIPGFFNQFIQLKYLDLSKNNISNLADGTFASPESLQRLNLSENVLTTLGEHCFIGITKLYILDLSKNKLRSLPFNIFISFQVLEELYLGDNQLKELGSNVFGAPSSIETLSLSNNILSTLAKNQFSRFSKLLSLDLSKNNLKSFDFNVLTNSTRIFLDLSNNNIKYLENVGNVSSLNLSHNLISNVNFSVPFTELLDLTYNNISNIESIFYSNGTLLNSLYLEHNNLKNLPENVFKNMPYLSNLNISHNCLEILPLNIFKDTTVLSNLDISYNYLDKNSYSHNSIWFIIFVSMTNLRRVILDHNLWRCSNLKDIVHVLKTNRANFAPIYVYLGKKEMVWGTEMNKTNILGIGCIEDIILKVNDSTIVSINSSIIDDLHNDVRLLKENFRTIENRTINEIKNIKNKQSYQTSEINKNKLLYQNLIKNINKLEDLYNITKLHFLQNTEYISHGPTNISAYFQAIVENILKSKDTKLNKYFNNKIEDILKKLSQNSSANLNIVERHENVCNNSGTFWEILNSVMIFFMLSALIYLCYLYKKNKTKGSTREEIDLISSS